MGRGTVKPACADNPQGASRRGVYQEPFPVFLADGYTWMFITGNVTGKKSGSGTICGFRNTEHCSARTKVYAGGAMLRAPFKPYRYQKSAKFAQPAATPGFNSQCPRAGQMKLTQPTLASTQPVTRVYPEFSASSEMGVRCGRHSSQIHYRPTLDSGANGRD
jgi:hypothetical protein